MNTYGAKLNAQELRNAEYSGLFKEFVYRFSAETLDQWLGWGLFNRQQIAEMRDAEFVSDLTVLVLRGRQAVSKAVLDTAYRAYENEFEELESVEARLARLRSDIGKLFAAGLKPFRSRMWAYTLFDLLQDLRFGGSIAERPTTKPRKIDLADLGERLDEIGAKLAMSSIPLEVLSATRGAATDLKSRQARYQYLKQQL
jgi:hypothetical protein